MVPEALKNTTCLPSVTGGGPELSLKRTELRRNGWSAVIECCHNDSPVSALTHQATMLEPSAASPFCDSSVVKNARSPDTQTVLCPVSGNSIFH